MATSNDYIEYVYEQISDMGNINYKKMFGEYMVYFNNKPVIIVCDNTPFVKILDPIKDMMKNSLKGFPYKGAKEHYILDIEDKELCKKVILELEKIIPLPKAKKK